MAFGAKFARAAQDDQTAYTLAQQAQEEHAEQAPVERPAAPTAATPRVQRPAFTPGSTAASAPVTTSTTASDRAPAPVPQAASAPVTPGNAPRRFVRPSQMTPAAVAASASAPAPAVTPVPSAVAPTPAAVAQPSAPVSETRPRFAFTRGGASTGGPTSAPASAPADPAPVANAAPTLNRPRPAIGRPSAPPAGGSAPRSGGFRPGGFRANGMGDAPPQPTGEDDDTHAAPSSARPTMASSAPAAAQPVATPAQRPARPAIPANGGQPQPVAAAFSPRAGGFRSNGVGASPARATGEEGETAGRGYGASRREASDAPRLGPSGLPVRLDRLIDVVCEHLGKTAEEIEQVKKRALHEQDAVTREFDEIFKNEVEPLRQQNAQRFETLKQAMDAHPNKVVFMHIKDGKQGLVGLDRATAGAKAMYEGQLIETVDASRTMFKAPSILFAAPVETVVDEAAFDEPAEAATPAPSRAPRI